MDIIQSISPILAAWPEYFNGAACSVQGERCDNLLARAARCVWWCSLGALNNKCLPELELILFSGHSNAPFEGPQMNGVGAATVKRTGGLLRSPQALEVDKTPGLIFFPAFLACIVPLPGSCESLVQAPSPCAHTCVVPLAQEISWIIGGAIKLGVPHPRNEAS